MSEARGTHSAAQSAAGYLYQARLALVCALRYCYRDSGIEIAVERIDDVSFEVDGHPLEILQVKHHLEKRGDLTDRSVDLWKTLRVWSNRAKSDPSLPRRTRFALVTTASAPSGSAASLLRPSELNCPRRDPLLAEEILFSACTNSTNKALRDAHIAFLELTSELRKQLIAAIDILDATPRIADLEDLIEESIRMIGPREKISHAREQLEGWWWPRLCREFQAETPGTIPVIEIERKLDDIRESMKRDALPLDMGYIDPPDHELDALDEMRFVRQLNSVGIGGDRLHYAKRDFYRASTQRSEWARKKLLLDSEVGRFDSLLIEEWEPRFAQMCDGLAEDVHELALREVGRDLYSWVESEARFPLREVSSRFLNVGSYQILADDLRVGWHRDYRSLHRGNQGEDPSGN